MASAKPSYPFWAVEKNFVINVQHIAWFQKHSDHSVTIRLTVPGPKGDLINVSDPVAVNDFITNVAKPGM